MRALVLLLWAAPAVAATGRLAATEPIADVWPYEVHRTAAGAWDYRYDLTALRASGGTSDAIAAHGADAVKAFLAGLPKEAHVTVRPGAQLTVGAGRGLEPVPLASAFSQVSGAPMASGDPLGHRAAARLRQPLAPEEPKLLLSADQVAVAADAALQGAFQAVLTETERQHQALWAKVYAAVATRRHFLGGDALDGADQALARLGAALSCLEPGKRPPLPAKDAALLAVADGEFEHFKANADLRLAASLEGCSGVRRRILAEPWSLSRGTAAGALLVVAALDADPKLKAQYTALVARRVVLEGGPAVEPLLEWAARGGVGAAAALEDLGPFLEAAGGPVPALFHRVPRLTERFAAELEPALRPQLTEELLAAAQDQRLFPKLEGAPPAQRLVEEPWAAFAFSEGTEGLSFERGWRGRLQTLFAVLQGLHREPDGESRELAPRPEARSELEVRLMVPPVLEVEPAPLAYTRAAEAAAALGELLRAQGLGGARTADGESAQDALRRWVPILRGLARISKPSEAALPDNADTTAARRFVLTWRSDRALSADLRHASAAPLAAGEERQHTAWLGVSRRELAVSFTSIPELITTDAPQSLRATAAEQRYLVPVIVSAQTSALASTLVLERVRLRAIVDQAQRQPVAAEDAFRSALKGR